MKPSLAACLLAGLSSTVVAAPTPLVFNLIQGFPDKFGNASVAGISGDGSVVCGKGESAQGEEAMAWKFNTGVSGLGDILPDPFRSSMSSLSYDGSAGSGTGTRGNSGVRAARWTAAAGIKELKVLGSGGIMFAQGLGISADGARVVGLSTTSSGVRAALWEGANVSDLGVLNPNAGSTSVANAISGDGSIVVGASSYNSGSEAFKWSQGGTMISLKDLPGGGDGSAATAISADGSTIVGYGTDAAGVQGVIFDPTGNSAPQSVGDLDGGAVSCRLLDVSGNGSCAVGYGTSASGQEAVVWDSAHGLRSLKTLLVGAGVNLSYWTVYEATGISDDGDVIVGNCRDGSGLTQGWAVSGMKSLLAGETPSAVRSPVPVIVRVSLNSALKLGSTTLAMISAEGPEAPAGVPAELLGGPSFRRLFLLQDATYSITVQMGKYDGQRTEVLTVTEPTTLVFELDGDTDGDGLLDSEELALGTKLDKADTDGDGLNDYLEVRVHSTDPKKKDTDGDRATDYAEVEAGTNPLDRASVPIDIRLTVRLAPGISTAANQVSLQVGDVNKTVELVRNTARLTVSVVSNATYDIYAEMGALTSGAVIPLQVTTRPANVVLTLDGDADGDGLLDSEEKRAKGDPNNPDTDGDGISDGDEVKIYGTKVYLADSDGDGFTDAQEIALGTGPTDRRSAPQAYIERQVTMDLGFRYIDAAGNARDEHVDTNGFIRWVSRSANSPVNTGTLWLHYNLDGSSLKWLIRTGAGDLDITRTLASTGLRAPNTFDAAIVEPHAVGEAYYVDQSYSYKVVGRNAPALTFVASGRSNYQSLTLPATGLRLDLATSTGDDPFLLQGTVLDPNLTGKQLGILYGNVNMAAEVARIQGTSYTLPE
ncbi:hypothetical protein [Haloferula sargassicola]|uniref:Uncharacterized protein n=1 Tax=Haloferula sargassicola TaxID=490096 RepID=A0ABP9UPS8_9BACT